MSIKIITCENNCWCEECSKGIKKGEKFILVLKNARRGTARVNFCKKCFIKFYWNLKITKDEEDNLRKEMLLEAL